MHDYYAVKFTFVPALPDACDYLASLLADLGYESFVAEEDGSATIAYIPAKDYSQTAVESAVEEMPFGQKIDFMAELVPGQDWNQEWEKHYFQPIVVADRVVVHSSFHTDVPQAEYDIVVDPRMAFGTGHHATTRLMLQGVLKYVRPGIKVLDMGTGTGILAILAKMAGAGDVTGIEIDPFAAENARENVQLNLGIGEPVKIIAGDASNLEGISGVELFLANINRNVITADIAKYVSTMSVGAKIVVSGFYVEDRDIVQASAEASGLKLVEVDSVDNWSSMTFEK